MHPDKDRVYEEWDPNRDAKEELEAEEYALDAQLAARDMPIEELEAIGRIVFRSDVNKMTSAELKKEICFCLQKTIQKSLLIMQMIQI